MAKMEIVTPGPTYLADEGALGFLVLSLADKSL